MLRFCRNQPDASTSAASEPPADSRAVSHRQYTSLGILPQVRLAERDHLPLWQRSTLMSQERLTVKVAPPDAIQPMQLWVILSSSSSS